MVRLNTFTEFQPIQISPTSTASVQKMFERVSKLVDGLASYLRAKDICGSYFDEVESELGGLPLATADFVVARHRLRNARRCAIEGEFGAACYELRLLARGLYTRPRN